MLNFILLLNHQVMKHTYVKYFLVTLLAFAYMSVSAQNVGDFRSVASGDWNSTSTWNTALAGISGEK